jgi:hypothetical protein
MSKKTGYIRVFNIRGDRDYAPEQGESIVMLDRDHPVLGNHKYVLKNKSNAAERSQVIANFDRDGKADDMVRGPQWQAIDDIAKRIIAGDKIAAGCWCTPLPCHVDTIVARVNKRVLELKAETARDAD